MPGHDASAPLLRGLIKLWFALDAVVALAPPLYWAVNGSTAPILGLPGALFYFLAVAVCIAMSIIAAWLAEGSDQGAAS